MVAFLEPGHLEKSLILPLLSEVVRLWLAFSSFVGGLFRVNGIDSDILRMGLRMLVVCKDLWPSEVIVIYNTNILVAGC